MPYFFLENVSLKFNITSFPKIIIKMLTFFYKSYRETLQINNYFLNCTLIFIKKKDSQYCKKHISQRNDTLFLKPRLDLLLRFRTVRYCLTFFLHEFSITDHDTRTTASLGSFKFPVADNRDPDYISPLLYHYYYYYWGRQNSPPYTQAP